MLVEVRLGMHQTGNIECVQAVRQMACASYPLDIGASCPIDIRTALYAIEHNAGHRVNGCRAVPETVFDRDSCREPAAEQKLAPLQKYLLQAHSPSDQK